jgi:hypothetical protein
MPVQTELPPHSADLPRGIPSESDASANPVSTGGVEEEFKRAGFPNTAPFPRHSSSAIENVDELGHMLRARRSWLADDEAPKLDTPNREIQEQWGNIGQPSQVRDRVANTTVRTRSYDMMKDAARRRSVQERLVGTGHVAGLLDKLLRRNK